MTHKDLVKIATKWARNRHIVVIPERSAYHEIPDVLAINYSYSTLIECKVSRADFLRDKNKITRRYDDYCAGNYRLYCVPKGLLKEDDIPETWGLLEVYPSGFVKLKVNLYKYTRTNAIWWHDDTIESLRSEKHALLNHFIYPKEKKTVVHMRVNDFN